MRTAVIVPVPEAEPAVGPLRARLDKHASWGIPAHVTVLAPFLPPERLDSERLGRLAGAIRSVPRFRVTFRRVEWFGEDLAWLAPDPPDGFAALTAAVCAAFPGLLPYEGRFGDPVPHLTVAADGDPAELREAAVAAAGRLPVAAEVATAHLFQSTAPDRWHSTRAFPLGQNNHR